MKYPLKWKLSLSYALMALVLVASVSLFSNLLLQNQFEEYIIRQQNSKNEDVVSQIAQQYNSSTKGFDPSALETIGMNALESGMIIRVSDTSGNVLWDAMVHNNGLCHQMLQSMAEDMQSRYPDFKGAYEEKNYSLKTDPVSAGSVTIGYYGPFYYTDNDAAFIDTLNRALFAIGIISLALAVFFGLYMARRISRPIAETIGAAEKIAKGNYKDKIEINSGTIELNRLIASVNSLSSELENQDLLRKRLTADIAHELRTPLSTLRGNIEALIDGIWQPDEKRLLSLHEETLRLSRLVTELERLAQLESENADLNKTKLDLKQLAEKTASSFDTQCLEKNIHMTVTGEAFSVLADSDKLRQVFINLISNSLKYTPNGGRVDIRISGEGELAKIQVEDNGVGISREDLPYIFERFYRADKSRSSLSGGAGIGLAIVKAIVSMHGGEIIVESEIDKGTCITFLLPVG